MIDGEKQRLRARMRELARQRRLGDSKSHLQAILDHSAWKSAGTVLLYSPLPGEPDPTILLPEQGTRALLFPRIEGLHLGIYRQTPESQWITGPYGLREPDPATWEQASPSEIELALIPGLAFDLRGGRLGRGKGYYDRLLGHPDFRGVKIGLAWEWQVVSSVPRTPLDIRMDLIIAGEKTHPCQEEGGSMLDKSVERE